MDLDLINFETLLAAKDSALAARDSADWAYWGLVLNGAMLLISLMTFLIAVYAINTWLENEKLNARLGFKKSVIEVKNALFWMPDKFDYETAIAGKRARLGHSASFSSAGIEVVNHLIDYSIKFEQLENSIQSCMNYWILTERQLSGTTVEKLWFALQDAHDKYRRADIDKTELFKAINALCSEEFVYSKKYKKIKK